MSRLIHSNSEKETRAFARELAATLRAGDVVALCGELGAGKTAVAKGICAAFGCEDQAASPTFTIINEYRGSIRIFHCDLYRISSIEEAVEAGVRDAFQPDALTLIEWPERAAALLPSSHVRVQCDYGEEEFERVFTVLRNGCAFAQAPVSKAEEDSD